MKYNDKLFILSGKAINAPKEDYKIDQEIVEKQQKVLTLLMEKYKKLLDDNSTVDDLLKARFRSGFWQEDEEGYKEIQFLLDQNSFESFFRNYCMYLGDCEYRCDEANTAYFDVLWDYQTYFENYEGHQGKSKLTRKYNSQTRKFEYVIE